MSLALVSVCRPVYYLSLDAALRHGEQYDDLIETTIPDDLAGAPALYLTCENGDKMLTGKDDTTQAMLFGQENAGREIIMRHLSHAD